MPSVLNLESVTKRYLVQQAQRDLPIRKNRENKTHGGKCLIVAGSSGYWGAGILCARAAARSGVGYTYVYDPKSDFPIASQPDFLTLKSLKNLSSFNTIALGPGFKNPVVIKKLFQYLQKNLCINVVLDAEALTTLSTMKKPFKIPSHWILTPHEGELARLIGISSEKIRSNREKYIQQAQKLWGGVFVLKGFHTLIAEKNSVWQIETGNPALAKAGTGDVLTGLIAAFLSLKVPPRNAACLAVYIHGLAADIWVKSGKDHLSLLATDVIELIPQALAQVRNS